MTRPNSSTTQSMLNILIQHIIGRCHASPRARFYVYMLFGILACPQNIACARHQRWRICSLTYIFMEGFDLPDLLRKARIKNEHVAYMLYTFTYTRLRPPPGPPRSNMPNVRTVVCWRNYVCKCSSGGFTAIYEIMHDRIWLFVQYRVVD